MTITPNACVHCVNGFFQGHRFGLDVECVNGILIDIDEAYEGARDVIHPVAPCHPCWNKQKRDPDAETWVNDSIERLEKWRAR